MSLVSLIHGPDRYANVRAALERIEERMAERIRGRRQIVVKPNFVTVFRQLAATHVRAVEAVLDVLTRYGDGTITIAEGAALGPTWIGFLRYGYWKLRTRYNVRLVNLNRDVARDVPIFDAHGGRIKVPVARTILDSDFRVSVTPLKTHDTVLVTLSLKNMVVGGLRGVRAKQRIHQGYPAINRNLFELAKIIPPDLSVMDGFEAMQGNGPTHGKPVPARIALASMDFLAVDVVAARLMGFDVNEIGYLYHCKEAGLGEGVLERIEIRGARVEDHERAFARHRSYREQLNWR